MVDREKERMQERRLKFVSEKFRAEETEGIRKIKGYPILFNVAGTPYRGSEWIEVIDPRALDDVDLSGLRLLVNHENHLLLARAGINLKYEVDNTGLFIDADLPNTTLANDTWELVSKNIMDGMSFRFWADRWETDLEKKVDRIMHITDIPECSVVTFPAYQQTVAIATESTNNDQRNLDDEARKKAEAALNLQLSIF